MGLGRPSLQTLHSKECICILKSKLVHRFVGTAKEITDIAAIQFDGAFTQVTLLRSIADGFKNIFVHL